ncbi:MAG: DinB family protein [Acidobacteriota bacterium]
MSIAQSLLPEFDQEMASTRTMLERVPEDKLSYKPDPKSMSMGRLAGHVAEMPGWVVATLTTKELDFAKGEYTPMEMTSRAQVLAAFDQIVADGRAALAKTSDETMMQPWTLRNGSQVMFTMPRIAVLRSMVMNHTIHHRAQLTVYFRLNGVSVPGLYGPSADEAMQASA